ncbi:hypothetical protein PENSPDRAFT_655973 [Peniophora sp. CONT]|nr:hypothetical protein PENSPDRAFT_655973 [Peniophora sp. CONT]
MTAGIDDLPAELLLPIFEYASLDDRSPDHPSAVDEFGWATATRRDPSTSTSISQVCSRWRHMSLSQHVLWSHLPRSRQSLTDLYCSRCTSSALDIEIRPEHFYGAMTQERVQSIFNLIPRASSLFVSCKNGLGSEGDSSALVASPKYPSIRYFLRNWEILSAPLHLEDLRMDLQWEAGVTNIFVELPRKVFHGQPLEKMRSVRFNYVLMRSPRTFIWPALRFAEFTNSQAWDSAASFVAFFSGVPLLEDFKFTRNYGGTGGGLPALDTTGINGLPPLRSVPMPKLKSFQLHGPYYDIFFTLALLEIPCFALVSLTLTGRWLAEYAKEKLQIMHDALTVHFARAEKADVHFDSVIFDGRTMVAAHYPRPENISMAILPPSFTLSIIPDAELQPDKTCRNFNMLCTHPVFTDTFNLTILWPPENVDEANRTPLYDRKLHGGEIRRAFDLYTRFNTLTLRGYLLCLLFCHSHLHSMALSNFTTLRLVGVGLSSDFEDQESCIMIHVLLRGLKHISDRVKRLELERCTIGVADILALQEGLGEGVLSLIGSGPDGQH